MLAHLRWNAVLLCNDSAALQVRPKEKKKNPMEVAEQDGATKRQELSELQTPPSPLLRSYLNTSASPSWKHQDISLQTLSLPTEAKAETNM